MNKVVIHVYGEEGKKINLANQLQTYLGVDVYLNDNLPKTVCRSCIVKLRMYYEWMELIMKTQKEFGSTSNDMKLTNPITISRIETDNT